jgi:hypothetical protein
MEHPVWAFLAVLAIFGIAGAILILAHSPMACVVVGVCGLVAFVAPWPVNGGGRE